MATVLDLPKFDSNAFTELKERMQAFNTQFDQFIAAGRAQLRRERDEFAAGMAEDRLAQRDHEQAIEQTKRAQADLETRLHNERMEVEEMQKGIDEYSDKRRTMEEYKETLDQQIGNTREAMAKKRGVMAAKRRELSAQNIKNKPELNAWETQLGLQIDSAGTDILRFTFTRLNSRDLQMPHWFNIDLSNSNYVVQECHPPLKTMQSCVDELNRTRDFSAFLKSLRKDFQALY